MRGTVLEIDREDAAVEADTTGWQCARRTIVARVWVGRESAVLDQRVLHQAHHLGAIRRDGETFHATIRLTPRLVQIGVNFTRRAVRVHAGARTLDLEL